MEKVAETFKIALVGGHSLELGFKMAGVTATYAPESPEEAESTIQKLLADQTVGIIVLSSSIARGIKDRKITDALTSSMKPLFIVVSDFGDKEEYKDNLRQLIMRALGVDIMKTKSS